MANSNENQIDLSHLPQETQEKLATFSPEDQRAFLVASGQMPVTRRDSATGDDLPNPDADGSSDPKPGMDIPEKFRRDSMEESFKELLKSYQELERKQSQGKPKEEDDPKDLKIVKPEEKPDDVVPPKGQDLNNLFNDMIAKGEIPEDALKEAGFNEDTIEYFRNLMEQTKQFSVLQAAELVGGMDVYKQIVKYAQELDSSEIEEINEALQVAPKSTMLGLKARFADKLQPSETNGQPTRHPQAVASDEVRGGARGYASFAEYQADLRNPKMKSDPSFARLVEERFVASKNLHGKK